MKINSTVYKYIEYELFHYEHYKKEIQLEMENILESSPRFNGQPKGNTISNPTESKCMKLINSGAIRAMQNLVTAVENMKNQLTDTHIKLFNAYYIKKRKDRYLICDELGISEATFTRYKRHIVEFVGMELNVIKL